MQRNIVGIKMTLSVDNNILKYLLCDANYVFFVQSDKCVKLKLNLYWDWFQFIEFSRFYFIFITIHTIATPEKLVGPFFTYDNVLFIICDEQI